MSSSHASQPTEDLWREDGYLRTSKAWIDYFKANKENLMPIPWESEERLSKAAKRRIGKSMATFQLGESSDGAHFMKAGWAYATTSGDVEYVDALARFIGEENRHARTLGRFMEQEQIVFLKKQWSDSIFRVIRKLADLNVCISVLITAEIIAKSYYRALRDATSSPVLKAICEQILRDEVQHVFFQSGALGRVRRNYTLFQLALAESLQRFLLAGSIIVVWLDHGKVYRAGGFRFWSFAKHAWNELGASLQIVRETAILGVHRSMQQVTPTVETLAGEAGA